MSNPKQVALDALKALPESDAITVIDAYLQLNNAEKLTKAYKRGKDDGTQINYIDL